MAAIETQAAQPLQAPPGAQPREETQPPAPPAPAPAEGSAWIAGGIVLLLFAALVFALLRKRSERRRELKEPSQAAPLEEGRERIEPEAPPLPPPERAPAREEPAPPPVSEAARAAERAADEARRAEAAAEAARVEAKRLLERARETADREALRAAEEAREAAARARAEAQLARERAQGEERRRKAEEEERKKAEYQARRAREAQEREQRRAAAEAARRRAEEEARQRALEEEAARERAAEEERRKIEAQAGKTLAEGLAKTRGGFVAGLNAFFGRSKVIDESVLGELEEVLFSADIGVRTASNLLEFARDKVKAQDLRDADKLKDAIRQEIVRIVDLGGARPDWSAHRPYTVMVVGVNGSGKTTTIGKLAAQLTSQGRKVVLAAGDTFRAAATEQLEVWGTRAGATVVKGREGADPGSVVFEAIKVAQAEGADAVLCDTAGRLHTKAPLMEELKRVKRIMGKAQPGSPHEILLVLDATNGQNAIAQAREFHAALQVDGIVLTKLDGTAKGGVIIGICDELKVPVRFVGIGEAIGDLKPFDARAFVQALFD